MWSISGQVGSLSYPSATVCTTHRYHTCVERGLCNLYFCFSFCLVFISRDVYRDVEIIMT